MIPPLLLQILPFAVGTIIAFFVAIFFSTRIAWQVVVFALAIGSVQYAFSVGGTAPPQLDAVLITAAIIAGALTGVMERRNRVQAIMVATVAYILVSISDNKPLVEGVLVIGNTIGAAIISVIVALFRPFLGEYATTVALLPVVAAYIFAHRVLMNLAGRLPSIFAAFALVAAIFVSLSAIAHYLDYVYRSVNVVAANAAAVILVVAALVEISEAIRNPVGNLDRLTAAAPIALLFTYIFDVRPIVSLLAMFTMGYSIAANMTRSTRLGLAAMVLGLTAAFAATPPPAVEGG